MPSVGEIDRAVGSYIPADRVAAIRTLIRAAVEKALAEQREAIALDVDLAKMCAERLAEELRVLRLIIQSDKVQRRREVIEAKIAAYEYAAWNTREAPFTSTLQALAAELAALEVKP